MTNSRTPAENLLWHQWEEDRREASNLDHEIEVAQKRIVALRLRQQEHLDDAASHAEAFERLTGHEPTGEAATESIIKGAS